MRLDWKVIDHSCIHVCKFGSLVAMNYFPQHLMYSCVFMSVEFAWIFKEKCDDVTRSLLHV